ncbi:RDD family protein [Pedobacter cryoconitis]|uniref:Putative RDD family membrane protein YckC n=1 Tax=Pedobacter cryoconitis TaxID=188932 RepID=A0A7X0MMT2_9SPHI|nr:RDD family protein [Pedobacter cryoconitis]MBB6502803.1 putative RDD family membrane protein YckC [Pedobacter cryoconitis]
METIKVNTSQHVAIDYPVAGLGERISARLIDLVMFGGLFLLVIVFVSLTGSRNADVFNIVLFALVFASYVFYNLLYEIFFNGQSVGKKLMKIKVISMDGSQASIGQYFIRWLFRLADFSLTGQVGALVCVAVTENKQRIGDLVAGTIVIKTVARTSFEQIAFIPVEEGYAPVFTNVHQLRDQDIELIHEVLTTYYKTNQYELVYAMAAKIAAHLSVSLPEGMNQLEFLNTILKDYNQLTSVAQ